MTLKDTCVAAGVKAADLARLLGITRISVHYWFTGDSQPNKFLAPKVDKVARALDHAVMEGDLPLKDKFPTAAERTKAIGAVIVAHHKKLSAETQSSASR